MSDNAIYVVRLALPNAIDMNIVLDTVRTSPRAAWPLARGHGLNAFAVMSRYEPRSLLAVAN